MSKETNIHKTTISEMENGRFSGAFSIIETYLDALGLDVYVAPKAKKLPRWDEIDELFGED